MKATINKNNGDLFEKSEGSYLKPKMVSIINRSTEEKKKTSNSFKDIRKDDEGMAFDDAQDKLPSNRRFNLNTYSSGDDNDERSYDH